ncbi:hypothetical protein KDH_05770 [Dictyobacter sp. S3.2.2.5]|uniref:Uncharacterized protein n=1 Tax=Dictyobacter halimunensis TaxID=3026934 RepID=A0ABQ6FMD1_9CHLR|nr:hypothetical protein KDH_05770 [Dictyobacter sp. S3.2.2.5]
MNAWIFIDEPHKTNRRCRACPDFPFPNAQVSFNTWPFQGKNVIVGGNVYAQEREVGASPAPTGQLPLYNPSDIAYAVGK